MGIASSLITAYKTGVVDMPCSRLTQMAEFSMLILVDRAQRRGVEQAGYLIREGNVRKQLLELATETRADVFVMGWPLRGPGRPVFTPQEFESFAAELEEVAHPRLVQVPPSEA